MRRHHIQGWPAVQRFAPLQHLPLPGVELLARLTPTAEIAGRAFVSDDRVVKVVTEDRGQELTGQRFKLLNSVLLCELDAARVNLARIEVGLANLGFNTPARPNARSAPPIGARAALPRLKEKSRYAATA